MNRSVGIHTTTWTIFDKMTLQESRMNVFQGLLEDNNIWELLFLKNTIQFPPSGIMGHVRKLRFNLRKYMYISGAGGTGVRGAVPMQILADQLPCVKLCPPNYFLSLPPLRIFEPYAGSDHLINKRHGT